MQKLFYIEKGETQYINELLEKGYRVASITPSHPGGDNSLIAKAGFLVLLDTDIKKPNDVLLPNPSKACTGG